MTPPEVDFATPPVVEVALGVQFRPLFGIRGITLGRLWERWRTTYPRVEEQPPLPAAIETTATPGELTFQLNLGPSPALRYWFLNENGTELVQVQQDRLIVNWREGSSGEAYPRYRTLRRVFEERLGEFTAFVSAEDLGSVDVTQVEVNYINAVDVGRRGQGDLGVLLRQWGDFSEHHLGDPEQARLGLVFAVPEIGREPVRMHVGVDPARRSTDGAPVFFFTLMVRGAPVAGTAEAALGFMDQAHDHLLRSFHELTSDAVRTAWGERE